MRERLLIFFGLFLFMALVTFPIWKGVAAQSTTTGPRLKAVEGYENCVAPLDTMRTAHMTLLKQWRDGKVRENITEHTAHDGKVYPVNLTKTCLGCHGSKDQFCISCHSYVGVAAVDCWDCHTSPPADGVAPAGPLAKWKPEWIEGESEKARGTR